MDNKRKGSSPPASGDDEPGWREPVPREPSPFEFTDDDDGGPLPAPPEFDGRRENVPDLLEGDLADDDIATAEELETEEPELLEGSIIMEVPRTHRVPPPIPAPVPLTPGRPSPFIDDGEIALPPRISQGPQSFPFRQLRRDPPSGLFQAPPPEPTPNSAGWRSAALRNDHAPEEEEAEEVEADEIPKGPAPPPFRPSAVRAPPPAAFTLDLDDDDDSAPVSPATPEPSRYRDPASMFVDAEAHETLADAPAHPQDEVSSVFTAPQDNPTTGLFDLPADDDAPSPAAEADPTALYRVEDAAASGDYVMPRPPQPSAAIPVAAIDDDDDAAWTVPATTPPAAAEPPPVTDDEAWSPAAAAEPPPVTDDAAWSTPATEPPPVTDDDEAWSPPAAAPVADDDAAWSPPATADLAADAATSEPWSPPAAIAADDAAWSSPVNPPATDDVWPAPPVDDAAIPPVTDDDDSPPPATITPVAAPITDDDDWSQVGEPPPPPVADDEDSPPPVAAAPADDEWTSAPPAAPVTDDDEWTPAPPATAPVTDDDEWTPAPPATAPVTVTDDDEWTPAPPATAVTDDDEWTPAPPASRAADVPTPHQPALSGAIMVADHGDDDDDEWVPRPPPATIEPAPAPAAAMRDEDDEWEPQTATVGLAPVPTDLGEAFPLDLWSDPDELVGRDLGRYRLIKPLSRGMVSRVYVGEVASDERVVAVRVLAPTYSPAEPRARQFLYEAQQLTRLRGENLVDVLESGSTPDHLSYYAMELLDGDTLATAIRAEGPLPWSDVAAYANQICDALIVAAASGIVHSDLTPATCMRLRPPADEPAPAEGEERRREKIKLLGVGITPLLSVYRNAEGALSISQGTPPGTAEYMAPEIASGGNPDVHTEIYALGVIMYELLTGRPPFRGDSFLAVLKKQMYDEPVAPHLVVPEQEIPEAFEKVVLKALAKAPADRFADLRALDEALLATRAREGELRRVTQILALDPTDWDEEGSRNSALLRPPSAPARAASEPIPLATFAADLKEKNPELAAKVFDHPKPAPPPRPVAPPSATPTILPQPTQQLTHFAAPVTAPPPVTQPPAPYILQLPPSNSSNVRNISFIIIAVCFLGLIFMWANDRRGSGKTKQEVAAETNKKTPQPKKKTSKPTPVDTTPKKTPAKVVPEPPPVKQVEPPTKQIEPEPVEPPTKQVEPPPVEPPPTKQVEPPPTKQVDPPPTKQPDPPPTKKPDDSRPERLDPNKIKSKAAALDARAKSACATKSGMKDPKGIRVIYKVTVSPKGAAKVTATGAWAGTPLGICIEQTVGPALHFSETRTGGTYKHTINF